jgi:hypothetical protein
VKPGREKGIMTTGSPRRAGMSPRGAAPSGREEGTQGTLAR